MKLKYIPKLLNRTKHVLFLKIGISLYENQELFLFLLNFTKFHFGHKLDSRKKRLLLRFKLIISEFI